MLEVMLENLVTVLGQFRGSLDLVQMRKLRLETILKACPKAARIQTKCIPNLCSFYSYRQCRVAERKLDLGLFKN